MKTWHLYYIDTEVYSDKPREDNDLLIKLLVGRYRPQYFLQHLLDIMITETQARVRADLKISLITINNKNILRKQDVVKLKSTSSLNWCKVSAYCNQQSHIISWHPLFLERLKTGVPLQDDNMVFKQIIT